MEALRSHPGPIDLAGTWRFALDRADVGINERWFGQALPDHITLPGSLPAQGIGDPVTVETPWTGKTPAYWYTAPEYAPYRQPGNVKVSFWLQPDTYYVGAAWYQRDIEIPEAWQGKRTVLTLERPHWETRVWLDERFVGTANALGTPHDHDLGPLAPGTHRLTIRVDNRLVVDVGQDSHSVSDNTQGNWNGIVGQIEIAAVAPVWIEDVQVYPHVTTRSITVKGRIGNATGAPGEGTVTLGVEPAAPTTVPVSWSPEGGTFEAEIALGENARLWDEFDPFLYRLDVALDNGDSRSVTFGLREIAAEGTQLMLNGRPLFLRGTLECAIFPQTGHPPTDVAAWKRILGICRAHGLNHLRFHSWCPPEAAFVAADEMGFYYQVEACSWGVLGDGGPLDLWIYEEADRILKRYGNHPCLLLMAYGNEPHGKDYPAYLRQWVNHYKARDPRRLFTGGAGWPQIAENQFHVTSDPRIQAWGAGLQSRINALPPETRTDYRDYIGERGVPVISHEIGQWCAYPNFDEIPKYTGYLKPKNFEIFRDRLEANGLGDLARPFLLASGKLQTLCYKEDIESALRTPGMGGFQLLDLHDFPGQGTALVGVLDAFWESKGYVTPGEYRRFCNAVVPLARLGKRVFTADETLEADLEVAQFGPAALENATTYWRLVADDGSIAAQGDLPARTLPIGNGIALGSIRVDLTGVPTPARYKLVVGLAGTEFENDWDVWVYPPDLDTAPPAGVTITHDLNEDALAELASGGTVLLLIPSGRVKGDENGVVALGFSSIFWNTGYTDRQPPHTLGILCDPEHPMFAHFPTSRHINWQWWYLIHRAGAMLLSDLPPELRPLVTVIDDWYTARQLALAFEARVGRGKLLACSVDLIHNLEADPVTRQFRHSLLRYLAGDSFQPAVEITPAQTRGLIAGS